VPLGHFDQTDEGRQRAAALASSLQTEEQPLPDFGPPADGGHTDKSLVF
jgi:hypothetical protein